MMIRSVLLVCLLFLSKGLFSQGSPDSFDHYNSRHKKDGLWTVYLDEFTNKVDKKKAVFIGYELFDNGACVYRFAKYGGTKKCKVEFDGKKGVPGNPVVLNGNHKIIIRASGKTSYECRYQNGRPLCLKAYAYDKRGSCKMTEILDFENKYRDIDGTFYYQIFGYDQQPVEKGYYRKGIKGWSVYKD